MADSGTNADRSLGEKLLGFFIREDPADARPATVPPVSAGPSGGFASNSAPPGPPSGQQTGPTTGSVDTKFVDHFAAVLNKTNLPGPDYFEFRQMLLNLNNLGLPEDKQFQAAWASFKTMATTGDPALLGTSATQYLTALSADRDAFLKSVEVATQERVGGLKDEEKKLQADNEAMAKQMAELQQRTIANTDRLAKISGEVLDQSAKINQNKANFETTYTTFTDQIKTDVSKISTYLK